MGRWWRWLVVAILVSPLFAQEDPQLRAQAVRMLEHAAAVAQPPAKTAFRDVVTISWFGDGGGQTGQIVAAVVPGVGYKRTYDFGNYHAEMAHHSNGTVMMVGDPQNPPTALRMALQLNAAQIGFDHEDVIQAINSSNVNGRPANCVVFESVFGEKRQQNEVCVDAQNGAMLQLQLGNTRREFSDIRGFAGSYYPGRTEFYRGGVLLLSMTEQVSALEDAAQALDMPSDARLTRACNEFRRGFAQNMPQPPQGLPGAPADIAVHVMIGPDGQVRDAVVDTPEHRELHAKALEIVSQWTFTAPLCDGKPAQEPATLVVHFR